MDYTIKHIAQIINGKLVGDGDKNCKINQLIIDSRNIISPRDSLFFAIVGERNNGHIFVDELYKHGLRNFVVASNFQIKCEYLIDANFTLVENTLNALQKLSTAHRKEFSYPVIGITGSNGKTIVKEWLSQLLSFKRIVKNPKSYNSQVGVPLSVWRMEKSAEIGIFEAGISKVGEMSRLEKIIAPTIGIFTNIGTAHQENFESLEQKIIEKLNLFSTSEILIYCKDFKEIENQIKRKNIRGFSWSFIEKADLQITRVNSIKQTTQIIGEFKNKEYKIEIPFTDKASIENAIHCLATLLYLGIEPKIFVDGFKHLQSIEMRLELKQGINNCTIINDSYNSDIGSLQIALELLKQQKQNGSQTLIISDILQSGIEAKILYKKIADIVNNSSVNRLIGIGTEISKNITFFNVETETHLSTADFISNFDSKKFNNEAVLIKGARVFEFEKISRILQQQNHETVLEINLNAITHNLNYFKSLLKPSVKLMAMVKAFSYGSGTGEIANLLQFQRVDYLAVAFADEGIELRNAGITTPIMVMNSELESFNQLEKYQLEPEIFSFRMLNHLLNYLQHSDIEDFPIHIKIDTGMKRLGFLVDEISDLITEIKKCKKIQIKSVFTHLVASDNPQMDEFTTNQLNVFKKVCKQFSTNFTYPIIRHALNSSGIERFEDAQFDMVRLGIGLYGISSTHQDNLMNISSLKTTISQLKKVKKGESIGYRGTNVVNADSIIATIPIGYADGLNRKLSNGVGSVLIQNKLLPIVGDICMDMCMIDVSGLKNINEGDEVIIFNEKHTISTIAKSLGTIPYEILTGISRRVKRVYIQE
ncbi:MAG TPA: bifunctional UDP-N-acetylmuramoyl-tripeptide:D-alanyl-D-alanine ligase/alanine racemase [Bacteroidales bacterium]|nr:MAG: hypothetical protein A2W98_11260 [Bacteroidetes bacterium GWF2_33_38]OFY70567.1 MAG: hypothetical protein A2265_11260 [Bacteroidetes bacterium RIFOXYA12_FULL_33_9]OFY86759.1 MAG: hypothetical protein A2236_10400 [Bacteroidetes bacterium RIFOXYA2_FULL_33_7]HBF88316.1 bifunctional UDP-N-acetylmuramoyl-tripeptide:D-alanyl-D-alanine ligase/alanine racemase [Bacteroidales bacterium]